MLKPLKQFLLDSARRRGIGITRVPKDRYRLNAKVGAANRDEIRKIAREETLKNPDVRPTWTIADRYLNWKRISFYCDVVDLLAERQVPIADRRIIEIGACYGVTLRLIHQRYPTAKLFGTECLEKALAVGRRICPQADMRFETVATMSFDEPFDVVIMTEVLEHMADPAAELHRLNKIVQPGGYLLLTVPNGRIDSGGADEYMPAANSYRGHINFWSPESWKYFLERTFPTSTVQTGHMPKDYIYQLYGLVRKPGAKR